MSNTSTTNKSKKNSKRSKKSSKLNIIYYSAVAIFICCYYYFTISASPSAMDYKVKIERQLVFQSDIEQIDNIELPAIKDSTYFVRNKIGRYSYMYSPKHLQSKWVAYKLTRNDVMCDSVSRSKSFKPDPELKKRKWKSASTDDYYQSSFNRGHYVPSSDRKGSKAENAATFLLTNISPQYPRLNSGAWLYLEKKAKEWACLYSEVYITMGGLFDDKDPNYIGSNHLAVPTHLFKVLLMHTTNGWECAGFIMPNNESIKENYLKYIVSVNKVEKLSGIDFFTHIPDDIERKIEKKFNIDTWK